MEEKMDEFVSVVNEYHMKLTDIFIGKMRNTVSECNAKRLGPLETFINVMKTLNKASIDFGCAIGIEVEEVQATFYDIRLPEDVVVAVCDYLDDSLEEAREEVKKQAEDVLNSETIGELMIKYNNLSRTLEEISSIDCIDLFADIEVAKKALTKNN